MNGTHAPDGDGQDSVAARPAPSRGQRRRRRLGCVAGIAAALVVALLIAVVGAQRLQRHDHTPAVAWRPPPPSLADLTRGFPAPSVAHATGALSPTVSLAAPPHGVPYAGHVRLSTVPLPTRAFLLQAFRLVPATTVAAPERVPRLARHLGIHAPIHRTTRGRVAWLVAAERGTPA